jgi:biopolymer transport protein ExbB/biopolymer transport protein TolQ
MSIWSEAGKGGIGPVAWGVIVVLLGMSILSIAVMIERYWTFRRAARESRRFALDVSRLLRAGKTREAAEWCRSESLRHSHLARSLGPGLDEWLASEGRREGALRETIVAGVKEAVNCAAALELADLKRGLSALATIGATAPFVGLFGTTFGIIDAFKAIAVTGSGGIAAVSQGISEALITTAFGLLVAVPAVWAYNYFSGRIERFGVEIDRGSHEMVRFLAQE